MADIVERLRGLADLFEAGDAPRHLVLHMRAGADEIERKKAEIASLLNTLADARTESMKLREWNAEIALNAREFAAENERLRAALGLFACDCIESGNLCPSPQNCRNYIARAAMEEGMTSPDEREDCTGLEDSSTANPCGREDCEEEDRSCTCHPSEAPTPCQRKYALGDCIKAALEGK